MREQNFSNNPDLPRRAYVRGLFMEALAARSALDVPVQDGGAFLCGAFSLLENIMGAPPKYLLGEIGIPAPVWDALLGGAENDCVRLLRYVTRYEAREMNAAPDETQMEWNLSPAEIETDLDEGDIERLYQRCGEAADAAIVSMDTPA